MRVNILDYSHYLPKVCNLDCLMVTKEILWFQITMQVVVFVHVCETL